MWVGAGDPSTRAAACFCVWSTWHRACTKRGHVRASVFRVAVVVLPWVAVACSGGDKTRSADLPVCDPKTDENACERPKMPKQDTTGPGDETPIQGTETTTPDNKPTVSGDGGAAKDAAVEASLGSLYTKLRACCQQLEQQGYSPAACQSVVDTHNESACYSQHQQYKMSGDCS